MIRLRKSPVVFNEEEHTYWLGDKQLRGITSTLIKRAFPDKYSGIPESVLANAARKGHELHAQIEFHDNFRTEPENIRIANYERLKEENGLKVVANEYLVSDEKRYASSIDIVMQNIAEEVCITDTKTTWNLDKASVALQLSIYKRLFELQNPGLEVKHAYALWLPNKDETVAELIELPFVDDSTLDALFEADINDKPFTYEPAEAADVPEWYAALEDEYSKWTARKSTAEARLSEIKERLMALMEENGTSQIKSGMYTVSLIPAKETTRFDSALFKKENKDLFDKYQKETVTAAQIRFTTR